MKIDFECICGFKGNYTTLDSYISIWEYPESIRCPNCKIEIDLHHWISIELEKEKEKEFNILELEDYAEFGNYLREAEKNSHSPLKKEININGSEFNILDLDDYTEFGNYLQEAERNSPNSFIEKYYPKILSTKKNTLDYYFRKNKIEKKVKVIDLDSDREEIDRILFEIEAKKRGKSLMMNVNFTCICGKQEIREVLNNQDMIMCRNCLHISDIKDLPKLDSDNEIKIIIQKNKNYLITEDDFGEINKFLADIELGEITENQTVDKLQEEILTNHVAGLSLDFDIFNNDYDLEIISLR